MVTPRAATAASGGTGPGGSCPQASAVGALAGVGRAGGGKPALADVPRGHPDRAGHVRQALRGGQHPFAVALGCVAYGVLELGVPSPPDDRLDQNPDQLTPKSLAQRRFPRSA